MLSAQFVRVTLALLLLFEVSSVAVAAEVDVYLLSGQSNMQGVGRAADLPETFTRSLPTAFFWTGTTYETLVIGTTKTAGRPGEFGPEAGFASAMTVSGRSICLIKYHASGMPLHHGWNGNVWAGAEPAAGRKNFYPGLSADDPNAGTLYRQMLARFQAGLKFLSDRGDVPVVRGFLWMQGEQDSKHELSATTYATSLKQLRQRLTDDLHLPGTLPMAFGQVLPHQPALERFTHRMQIRDQMAAADSASGRPEALPSVKMISTDGFSLSDDTVHYNADGQLKLGMAFAKAMKEMASAEP